MVLFYLKPFVGLSDKLLVLLELYESLDYVPDDVLDLVYLRLLAIEGRRNKTFVLVLFEEFRSVEL